MLLRLLVHELVMYLFCPPSCRLFGQRSRRMLEDGHNGQQLVCLDGGGAEGITSKFLLCMTSLLLYLCFDV